MRACSIPECSCELQRRRGVACVFVGAAFGICSQGRVLSRRALLCHVSCHVMSCHVISCHVGSSSRFPSLLYYTVGVPWLASGCCSRAGTALFHILDNGDGEVGRYCCLRFDTNTYALGVRPLKFMTLRFAGDFRRVHRWHSPLQGPCACH